MKVHDDGLLGHPWTLLSRVLDWFANDDADCCPVLDGDSGTCRYGGWVDGIRGPQDFGWNLQCGCTRRDCRR